MYNEIDVSAGAIGKIEELVKKSLKPYYLESPWSNDDRFALVGANGETDGALLCQPRDYIASTVPGLCEMIQDLSLIYPNQETRVFVGNSQVTVLLDERGDRGDRLTMPTLYAESFKWLLKYEKRTIGQSDLCHALRCSFAGRYGPNSLLATLEKIKFRDMKKVTASAQHGNETIDLSVEKSLAGVEEPIPSIISLKTPVYELLADEDGSKAEYFDVELSLRCNLQDGLFVIQPLDGQLARALRRAREAIVSRIEKHGLTENVKIFGDCSV